jgi:hypothetical protein
MSTPIKGRHSLRWFGVKGNPLDMSGNPVAETHTTEAHLEA